MIAPLRWVWRKLFGFHLCLSCERWAGRHRFFCDRHETHPPNGGER